MTLDEIAEVAHEANRAYCAAIGDQSHLAWDDAPSWQRESCAAGVLFLAAHPEAQPKDSHNSWLRQKIADGWIYGPVKDPATKEHPCFVPYDQLPVEQRAKDFIYAAVVRTLIPHMSHE